MVYSHYDDDPECDRTAVEEARSSGKLDVLRRFKVNPESDDLTELLRCAALSADLEVIHYLLDLIAQPNDDDCEGCPALQLCLCHLEYEDGDHIRLGRAIRRWHVSRTSRHLNF